MTTDHTPDSDREAAIRARLEAATPGPWDEEWVRGAVRHIARNVDTEAFYDGETDFGWDRYNDAPLIANAPADLDYLLTALSEARAALAAAEAKAETRNRHALESDATIDQLKGAVRSLLEQRDSLTNRAAESVLDAVLREEGA